MKQNITMIFILILLFLFGLIIYDFSDKLDKEIIDHTWYKIEEGKLTALEFTEDKVTYQHEDKTPLENFQECSEYNFNKSISVIKLDCKIKDNKIYLTSLVDDKLTLKISGEDKTFYKTAEDAIKYNFIITNNLNEEDFKEIIEMSITDLNLITPEELKEAYNSKQTKLIAYINEELTIQNALNLKALYSFLSISTDEALVLVIDTLSEEEIKEINKYISIDQIDVLKEIPIYQIGNKKHEYLTGLFIENKGATPNIENENI